MQTRDGFGISILRKLNSRSVRVSPAINDVSELLIKKVWRKLTGNSSPSLMTSNQQVKMIISVIDSETSKSIEGAEFTCPQRCSWKNSPYAVNCTISGQKELLFSF